MVSAAELRDFHHYKQGTPIFMADRVLDARRSNPLPVYYNVTVHHDGEPLREATESLGGSWQIAAKGYDVHNIPYNDGVLIIERLGRNGQGHRVSFLGDSQPSIDDLIEFLDNLCNLEKEKHKQFFGSEPLH